MVRKLVKAKLAPKTIKNIMTVLNSALEQAVKAQTLQRNPAKYAKIPAVRVKEIIPSRFKKLLILLMQRKIRPIMRL